MDSASPAKEKALPRKARGPAKFPLPVELQRELKLPRIVRGRRLAGIGPEHVDRGDVDAVGDVEHVDDQVGVEALVISEIDALGDAHVGESDPRRYAAVAAQVAVERLQRSGKARDARLLKNSSRREFG